MKIREGFVTNSSSTNFIILSKDELTQEYLYKKLGFQKKSIIQNEGLKLCDDIINGIGRLRWYDYSEINEVAVKEVFGNKTAKKYRKLLKKGYHAYWGYTGDDEGFLTLMFTLDSFIIDKKDIYINAENCNY